MKIFRNLSLLICLLLGLCSLQAAYVTKTQVVVMIEAQAEAVRTIGGPRFDVKVLVPKHMTPENFTPSSRDIIAMRGAKLMFTLGLPFEKAFLPKVREALPGLRIIDCTTNMKFRSFVENPSVTEDVKDPHVWLSIDNMIEYSKIITPLLAGLAPVEARDINLRGGVYCTRMEDLKKELAKTLEPIKGTTFLVSHPAFGYFFDDFGLKQLPLEKDGKKPSTMQMKQFINQANELNLKVVLSTSPNGNDQVSHNAAAKLKGHVESMNPLVGVKYSDELREMAKKLVKLANQ